MNPSRSLVAAPVVDGAVVATCHDINVQEEIHVDTSIHFPHFWPDVIPADLKDQKTLQDDFETRFENADWLPAHLQQEIECCFPTDEDIDRMNEGQRCPKAFSKSISAFFKVGRVFVNYKQLAAAGQVLLDAWAVSVSHGAKSLICFYGAPSKRGKESINPNRQPIVSPKQICCPFRVSSYARTLRNKKPSHFSRHCFVRFGIRSLIRKKSFPIFSIKLSSPTLQRNTITPLVYPNTGWQKSNLAIASPAQRPGFSSYVPFDRILI